ncbi:hypothetical protein ABT269_38750 [Streptomyces viridosporus]|uniref:hypothetical protein n=1 Tax=Streptomyces viridosporus TaxID=67581 RepID=UPI0033207799
MTADHQHRHETDTSQAITGIKRANRSPQRAAITTDESKLKFLDPGWAEGDGVDDVPLLEMRIPRGKLPRRRLMTFLGLCAGCGALSVLLKVIDTPGSSAASACAVAFLLVSAGAAAAIRGDNPAFTTDGVRLKAFFWDRGQVLVPWSEIDRMWIARLRGRGGEYDFLYILPQDPDRYMRSGDFLRAYLMARLAADQGSALQIHLPVDGLSQDRIRAAVEELSAGHCHVD